jgi:hypothetical protein
LKWRPERWQDDSPATPHRGSITARSWFGWSWLGWSWLGWSWLGWSWLGWSWLGWSWLGWSWLGVGWLGVGWLGVGWLGVGWLGVGWRWGQEKVFGRRVFLGGGGQGRFLDRSEGDGFIHAHLWFGGAIGWGRGAEIIGAAFGVGGGGNGEVGIGDVEAGHGIEQFWIS